MKRSTNNLDNVRVASPCPANWDEMYGDDRKRFCRESKLNVYDLSDMTRREAEDLIANWEGRLCVRFYRRADGTVLTKDCPVGWAAVKRRLSRAATAVFSMLAGLFAGVAGNSYFGVQPNKAATVGQLEAVEPAMMPATMGDVMTMSEVEMGKPAINSTKPKAVNGQSIVGRITDADRSPASTSGPRR